MPQRVVDLLAFWRVQFGRHHSIVVWKTIQSCLMWCIWRKTSIKVLKIVKRMEAKLKAFVFKTLYYWMAAYNCFHISSVHDFLDLVSFS
jgi:hypothetical protein